MQAKNNSNTGLNSSKKESLNNKNIFQTKNSISCVNKKAEKVIIPENITAISFMGFSDCENLTKLDLHDNITSIGKSAFDNCKKLETISLSKNITKIDDKVFFNCFSLIDINLPDSIKSIGEEAFYNCQSIKSLDLPDNIDELKDYSFKNCINISSINMPKSLDYLGEGVFFKCQSLEKLSIPNNIDTLGTYLFAYCSSLKEVNLSDNVKSIKDFAFLECSSLEKITLPETLESISTLAFSKCKSLNSIKLPAKLKKLSFGVFSDCTKLESAVLPGNMKNIPASLFKNCSALKTIQIPKDVTCIGNRAFEGCKSITDIDLPKNLNCIASMAFYGCESLKYIALPETLNIIGPSAFDCCKSLEEVKIPNNILNLDKLTFFSCKNLKKVHLPKNLETIGFKCFANCLNLEEINFENKLFSIDNSAFENCTSLIDMRLPDSLRSISQNAFKGCSNLNKVIIPNNVNFISNSAFDNCPKVVICAPKNSYAHKYTIENKIPYEEFEFIPLRKISFLEDSIIANKGDIQALNLVLKPENTNDIFEIKWSSSDEDVVSVDDNGVINCKEIGNAVITARTDTKMAKCVVLSNIKLESIKLDKIDINLAKGETTRLRLRHFPEEHILQSEPIWESSDKNIATVDNKGNITAVNPGKCLISCNLEGKLAYCNVDVKIPVQEIRFLTPNINIKIGDAFTLQTVILPKDTTENVELEWQCSNISILELTDKETFIAKEEGTCVIMASYKDKIATCIISITSNITSIHFDKDKISLPINKKFTPVLFDNNGNKIELSEVKCSIADSSVANLLDNGEIIGIKEGLTVLIAQLQGLIATCILNVLPDTINNFSINYVKESASVITGKGIEGAKIRAFCGTTPISGYTIVDEKNEFVLPIDNTNLSTEVMIEISKEGFETKCETVPVLKEFTEFSIDSIDEINESSLSITGRGHAEAHIRAYIKSMQIGKTALVNSNGSFTLQIPRVKPNTTVTLKMRKSYYVTASKNITIKE